MDNKTFRKCVNELLELIRQSVPAFVSPNPTSRQFAAAGLMKCCASIRGIRVLSAKGLGPLTVMIGRNLWETWLVSLYGLLGGESALEEINGDDVFWKRRLLEKRGLGSYWEDWEGATHKLNIKNLTEKLRLLLVNAEEMSPSEQSIGYDSLFGPYSLFGTHANLSTIGLYLGRSATGWVVVPAPEWPTQSIDQAAAIYTAYLAKFVFKAFGLQTDGIEAIGQALNIICRQEETGHVKTR
jgi:hypothetical protein